MIDYILHILRMQHNTNTDILRTSCSSPATVEPLPTVMCLWPLFSGCSLIQSRALGHIQKYTCHRQSQRENQCGGGINNMHWRRKYNVWKTCIFLHHCGNYFLLIQLSYMINFIFNIYIYNLLFLYITFLYIFLHLIPINMSMVIWSTQC